MNYTIWTTIWLLLCTASLVILTIIFEFQSLYIVTALSILLLILSIAGAIQKAKANKQTPLKDKTTTNQKRFIEDGLPRKQVEATKKEEIKPPTKKRNRNMEI